MFKKISLLVGLLIAFGSLFTACNKSEDEKNQTCPNAQMSGVPNSQDSSNCILYQKIQKSKNSMKGLYSDESTGTFKVDTASATEIGTTNRYKVMKVYRRNSTRFFYIMIENFRYKPVSSNGVWVYGKNEANAAIYGRLYDWQNANTLKSFVTMYTTTYNVQTGAVRRPSARVSAKLPKYEDFKDILESSTLPYNYNQFTIDSLYNKDYCYYDVFLAGIDLVSPNNLATAANPSLGGFRDNLDLAPQNAEFGLLNNRGFYWVEDAVAYNPLNDMNYAMEINRNNELYSVYRSALAASRYGFSVRYIFDPFM